MCFSHDMFIFNSKTALPAIQKKANKWNSIKNRVLVSQNLVVRNYLNNYNKNLEIKG